MKYIEMTPPEGAFRMVQLEPETEDEIREINEYNEWWAEHGCHCEDDTECYYVADGESDECEKHHWRCVKCGGITQVG